jgi:FdhE protein
MTATAALSSLKSQRPEWAPWLAVVEETLRDAGDRAWIAAVPAVAHEPAAITPFLAGTTVTIDVHAARSLLRRLIHIASRSNTPPMRSLHSLLDAEPDVVAMFKASLCQDSGTTATTAASCGADAGALDVVNAQLAVPFLQTCRQERAPRLSRGWREGYCRVCGTWPAFAEIRGIERSRMFRCGRCGDEWHARPLRCPYCGLDDHTALVSLVPETGVSNATIEGCRACLGYTKTLTRLQGCSPGTVMLDDLASVHLDVAAIEQGYTRPPSPGYRLDVTVVGGST